MFTYNLFNKPLYYSYKTKDKNFYIKIKHICDLYILKNIYGLEMTRLKAILG